MNLKMYKPTQLEVWINQQYIKNNILFASDLLIERVAEIFEIEYRIYDGPTFADWHEGEYSFIFLNEYLNKQERQEHFFHELAHPIKHYGIQKKMPIQFAQLQEIQANIFQLYSAMPVYMLEHYTTNNIDTINITSIADDFNLSEDFASRRLQQIQQRILQSIFDEEFKEHCDNQYKKYSPANWMPSTIAIMDKLERQKQKKGII